MVKSELKDKIFVHHLKTPIGVIEYITTFTHLKALSFCIRSSQTKSDSPIKWLVERELEHYFAGSLTKFSIPLLPDGTPFQQESWSALQKIPYGKIVSYQDQASIMHRNSGFQAIGQANKQNKIAIIIPCHRVSGKNEIFRGYAGGKKRRDFLVQLEAKATFFS